MLVDKFNPTTFENFIGHADIVADIKAKIASPDGLPHMMFYGPPGTGKTAISKIIASEIFKDKMGDLFFEFNASKDRGIDMIRGPITDLAKRNPIGHPYKIILMDEADHITADAQACMRAMIPDYFKITRFIFTCNYPYKLIPAIKSRFIKYELQPLDIKTVAIHLKKLDKKIGEGTKPDSAYIDMAKRSKGDLRDAMNLLEGNAGTVTLEFEKMSLTNIASMDSESKIKAVLSADPDLIFDCLWQKVKEEKKWNLLEAFADAKSKMNYGNLKEIFLCELILKI